MNFPVITEVAVEEPSPPKASAIVRAIPNPFRPSTSIRFRLAAAAPADLKIFSVTGRLVRTFDLGRLPAGEHAVVWNGTDEGGSRVGSGVYIARLHAPDGAHSMRVVLVR
jgi:hypothetical protein